MVQILERPSSSPEQPSYEELVFALQQKDTELVQEHQARQRLEAQLQQKDRVIAQQATQIQQLELWQQKTREIMCNLDSSPSFKDLSWSYLDLYPDEVLSGKRFHADVEKVQKHVGIKSKQTVASYHNASKELGDILYDRERGQNEKSGQRFTEIDIQCPTTFGTAPLNASKAVTTAREQEAKRREERTAKLKIVACPHCGCTDEEQLYSAVVPVCKSCGKAYQEQSQIIKTKDIRVVEESSVSEPARQKEPTKPTHEDTTLTTDIPSCEPTQTAVQPVASIQHEVESSASARQEVQQWHEGEDLPICPTCGDNCEVIYNRMQGSVYCMKHPRAVYVQVIKRAG